MYTTETSVTFKRFGQIRQQSREGIAVFNLALAKDAETNTHQLVPKKTGALDATIRVLQDLATGDAILIAGNATVNYAVEVELGDSNHSPHPYMLPAVMLTKSRAAEIARTVQFYK